MRLYLPNGIYETHFTDGLKKHKIPFKHLSTARKIGTVCGFAGLAGLVGAGIWYYLESKKSASEEAINFSNPKPQNNKAAAADSTTTATTDSVFNNETPETKKSDTTGMNGWTTTTERLPKGLNPGSYEYIRPDGSRTGIFNAHAVDWPSETSKTHVVKRGDTLWGIVNKEVKALLGDKAKGMSNQEIENITRNAMVEVCQDTRNPEYLNWEPGKCCQRLDIGDTLNLSGVKTTVEQSSQQLNQVA